MKIVSDFSDYYDHIQDDISTDNPYIIYFRRTRECDSLTQFQFQSLDYLNCSYLSDKLLRPSWSVTLFIVGFCGHLVRGVKIENHQNQKFEVSYTQTGVTFLSERIGLCLPEDVIKQSHSHVDQYRVRDDQTFTISGAPIFIVTPNKLGCGNQVYVNPRLDSVQFHKTSRSVETFREIKRFITNGLVYVDRKKAEHIEKPAQSKVLFDLSNSGWHTEGFEGLPEGY